MNAGKAMFAGVLAAAVMSLVAFVVRALGFPFGFEMLLGSWVMGFVGYVPWLAGLGIHLLAGAFFGLIYALIFRWLRIAGARAGILISIIHFMIAGFLLAAIPPLHPLVPEQLPAPGIYMSGYGPLGVALFVLVHLAYGAVMGGIYRRSTYARIPTRRGRYVTYP
jgi:hypothetical protein